LLHCISGWDRTPLWIGILRILLWAEGLVHHSLDAEQITYLVVAYDWLLFGHQLSKRMKEQSEIMYCAFWLLQYLTDDLYSFANTNIPQPEPTVEPKNVQLKRNLRSASTNDLSLSHSFTVTATPVKRNIQSKIMRTPIKEDVSSLSAPDFDTIKNTDEPFILPPPPDNKEPTERKKKILEVWQIFQAVYLEIVNF